MIHRHGLWILLTILCVGGALVGGWRFRAAMKGHIVTSQHKPLPTPETLLGQLNTWKSEHCAAFAAMAPGIVALRNADIPLADVLQGHETFDAIVTAIYATPEWDAATARRKIETRCLAKVPFEGDMP